MLQLAKAADVAVQLRCVVSLCSLLRLLFALYGRAFCCTSFLALDIFWRGKRSCPPYCAHQAVTRSPEACACCNSCTSMLCGVGKVY